MTTGGGSAQFSTAPPSGPGPWPYLVYDTVNDATGQDVGLSVKSAPAPGSQVGSSAGGSIVYGECVLTNTFNPEQGSDVDVGPRWLRIYWPSNTPGRTFAMSSPQDRYRAYVYLGYALSFAHNGAIRACQP